MKVQSRKKLEQHLVAVVRENQITPKALSQEQREALLDGKHRINNKSLDQLAKKIEAKLAEAVRRGKLQLVPIGGKSLLETLLEEIDGREVKRGVGSRTKTKRRKSN